MYYEISCGKKLSGFPYRIFDKVVRKKLDQNRFLRGQAYALPINFSYLTNKLEARGSVDG
jgi:hypothetical protein